MVATFLKNDDGGFDYPAALFSAFLIFAIVGMAVGISRAFRTGRILFSWGYRFGGSGQFIVERDNNPSGFWVVFTVYCLAILLSVGLIIGISFGLFRRLH